VAEGGEARDDRAVGRIDALPLEQVGVGNKPVALPVGPDPAPAVIDILALERAAVLEAAAVVRTVVVVGVALAADGARDLEGVLRIDDPRVGAADLKDFLAVDGAARLAEDEGARHLGGGHEVAERGVVPRDPVVGDGEDAAPDGLGGGVFLQIGAGLRDLGVGVERARGLEGKLRRADLRWQQLAMRDGGAHGTVREPRVAHREGHVDKGDESQGEGGTHA